MSAFLGWQYKNNGYYKILSEQSFTHLSLSFFFDESWPPCRAVRIGLLYMNRKCGDSCQLDKK